MGYNLEHYEVPPMQCGDFSCDTGWNLDARWTIAAGKATFKSFLVAPEVNSIDHDYAFTETYLYTVTFTITNWDDLGLPGEVECEVFVNAVSLGLFHGNGTHTLGLKAGAVANNLKFQITTNIKDITFDLDDIVMNDAVRNTAIDWGMFTKYGVMCNIIHVDANRNTYNYKSNYEDVKILIGVNDQNFS